MLTDWPAAARVVIFLSIFNEMTPLNRLVIIVLPGSIRASCSLRRFLPSELTNRWCLHEFANGDHSGRPISDLVNVYFLFERQGRRPVPHGQKATAAAAADRLAECTGVVP